MADDLIIKFFQEDLTEAEDQRLREILSSSPEEAYRFFLHAEAAYRNYGLPEPRRPKTGGPGGIPWTSWSLMLLLAGAVAWSSWKLVRTWGQNSLMAAPQDPPASSDPTRKGRNLRPKEAAVPEPAQEMGDAPEKTSSEIGIQGSRPVVLPTLVPAPVTGPSRRTHSNLEVVLHRKSAGQVLVRVLGPDGSPMVLLYDGRLEPGSWAFDWNGQGSDGRAASPGTYRIQMICGPVTQTKNVVIREK